LGSFSSDRAIGQQNGQSPNALFQYDHISRDAASLSEQGARHELSAVREPEFRALAYSAVIALARLDLAHNDRRDFDPPRVVRPDAKLSTDIRINSVQLSQLAVVERRIEFLTHGTAS
jgi:hypothetical protein